MVGIYYFHIDMAKFGSKSAGVKTKESFQFKEEDQKMPLPLIPFAIGGAIGVIVGYKKKKQIDEAAEKAKETADKVNDVYKDTPPCTPKDMRGFTRKKK